VTVGKSKKRKAVASRPIIWTQHIDWPGKTNLSFEKVLNFPGARGAFSELTKEKLSLGTLEFWLFAVGTASNKAPNLKRGRQKAAKLASKARALASEVGRLPIPFDAPSGPDLWVAPQLAYALLTYAHALDESISLFPRHTTSPRTDNITALLTIVKEATGRYHFAEIADLLNAVEFAFGRNPGWDVSGLRQLMYRWRQRFPKLEL
jgi:hypothetical protein